MSELKLSLAQLKFLFRPMIPPVCTNVTRRDNEEAYIYKNQLQLGKNIKYIVTVLFSIEYMSQTSLAMPA